MIINLETENVDETYQALVAEGKVEIVGEPVTQSYGTRYFTVKDLAEIGSTFTTVTIELR